MPVVKILIVGIRIIVMIIITVTMVTILILILLGNVLKLRSNNDRKEALVIKL